MNYRQAFAQLLARHHAALVELDRTRAELQRLRRTRLEDAHAVTELLDAWEARERVSFGDCP